MGPISRTCVMCPPFRRVPRLAHRAVGLPSTCPAALAARLTRAERHYPRLSLGPTIARAISYGSSSSQPRDGGPPCEAEWAQR
ncbi:hypothetical protein OIU79_020357, partial [Salix purpurea]